MKTNKKYFAKLYFLLLVLVVFFVWNISNGKVSIPFLDIVQSLLGNQTNETFEYIIKEYRIPKAIAAILVGASLSVCGLFMQTFFKNPLSGPYVLGISSGALIMVAIVIMASSILPPFFQELFLSNSGIALAAIIGSLGIIFLIYLISLKINDRNAVLIVGLMISSFTSAFISIISYFTSAENLQKFTFWSMGNLGNLNENQLYILSGGVVVSLLLFLSCLKTLDVLLLGNEYVKSLGINLKQKQNSIFFATALSTGICTAFVGPIAFVGLAVPHIVKLVFKTSLHKKLFIGCIIIGSILMLFCDIICNLPSIEQTMPINAVTSIVGAPVVVWLLLRKNKFL